MLTLTSYRPHCLGSLAGVDFEGSEGETCTGSFSGIVLLLPGMVFVWHLSVRDLLHLDLKIAFLQGETYDLDRRVIHVQLPTDMGLPPYLVGLCTRSVYGLADAPHRWWNRLDKFLISLGIQPTRADRCSYVCHDGSFLLAKTSELCGL